MRLYPRGNPESEAIGGDLWTGAVAVQPFDGSPESGEAGGAVETGTVFLPASSLGTFDDPLGMTLGPLIFFKTRLASKSPVDSPLSVPYFDCLHAVVVPVRYERPSALPLVGQRAIFGCFCDAVGD